MLKNKLAPGISKANLDVYLKKFVVLRFQKNKSNIIKIK